MAKHRQRKPSRKDDFKHRSSSSQLDSLRQRQLIFAALYRGINAGMTPAASIAAVTDNLGKIASRNIIADLESGSSVTQAITKNRLGSHFDRSLVRIGETSGQLAKTTQFIAERYERIIEHRQRLKSKLRMPLFVGFLAIIVLPLPGFVAGVLSPWRYFTAVLLSVLLLVSAWRLTKYFFIRQSTAADGYPAHRFIGIPLLDQLLIDYSRANFIERLHLLVTSGYPVIEAIELSHNSLLGFARRMRYRDLAPDLQQGYSLADTFEHHEILTPTHFALLSTGEAAGRLEEALGQISGELRATVERKLETFVTWFPRIVYAGFALAIVSNVL